MIISAQLHGKNCISMFLYSDSEAWMLHYVGVALRFHEAAI